MPCVDETEGRCPGTPAAQRPSVRRMGVMRRGGLRQVCVLLAVTVACSEAKGIERIFLVPVGIGRTERTFCFPAVLVENWHKYRM